MLKMSNNLLNKIITLKCHFTKLSPLSLFLFLIDKYLSLS